MRQYRYLVSMKSTQGWTNAITLDDLKMFGCFLLPICNKTMVAVLVFQSELQISKQNSKLKLQNCLMSMQYVYTHILMFCLFLKYKFSLFMKNLMENLSLCSSFLSRTRKASSLSLSLSLSQFQIRCYLCEHCVCVEKRCKVKLGVKSYDSNQ